MIEKCETIYEKAWRLGDEKLEEFEDYIYNFIEDEFDDREIYELNNKELDILYKIMKCKYRALKED